MASNRIRGGLVWILGKSSWKELASIGKGCPLEWLRLVYFKTWFSGGLGCAGFVVGVDDPRGLF